MIETKALDEKWYVSGSRLADLEKKAAELERCKNYLRLARAERDSYKEELIAIHARQRRAYQEAKHHISISGNTLKKYGVLFLAKKLGIV